MKVFQGILVVALCLCGGGLVLCAMGQETDVSDAVYRRPAEKNPAAEKPPAALAPQKALELTRAKAQYLQAVAQFLQAQETARQKEAAGLKAQQDFQAAIDAALKDSGAAAANCTLNEDLQTFSCPKAAKISSDGAWSTPPPEPKK